VTPAQPSWLSLSVPCGRSSALDPCCGAPVRAPQLAPLGLSALVTARLASLRRSFPARVTYHPRWLSRGFASPQHIRRDRSSSRRRRPLGPRRRRMLRCPSCDVHRSLQLGRAPPVGFDHPCDGLLPIVPCGRRRSLPQRSRDSPFGAFPHPDRYRSPGPCPPAVPWWRSVRPLRVRFRALSPG